MNVDEMMSKISEDTKLLWYEACKRVLEGTLAEQQLNDHLEKLLSIPVDTGLMS